MSALKSTTLSASSAGNHPYPSWEVLASTVDSKQGLDAVDRQAQKEARIWRELAEEPQREESSAGREKSR